METFKGKVLSAFTVIMMVLLLVGGSSVETQAASTTHTHNGLTYTAITKSNYSQLKNAGSYYLAEDITISSRIDITSGTVNLCLNGKTISYTGSSSLFYVENATLNIYDCAGTGVLKGGKGYYFGDNNKGGAIYLRHATLNMHGGTISGNKATWGGAVFIDGSDASSTFNMYGGTISGNTAANGGGGVEVENSNSYFNMYAGSIINNTVSSLNGGLRKGGGVHFAAGTVRIYGTYGDVNIKGNKVADVENNLYLRSDKLITIPTSATISSTSSIGVSSADCENGSSKETIISSYGANNSKSFFLDGTNTSSYLMVYENSSVAIVKKTSHTHNWIQGQVIAPSVDSAGITSYTCSTCGSTKEDKTYLNINDEKITIENANSLTYNGQTQSQTLNVYYDGVQLTEGVHYTLSNNAKTNAGSYTLTITGKGVFTGSSRTYSYVINKATPLVVLADKEVSYDGTALQISAATVSGVATNNKPTGTITYTYYKDAECTVLTNSADGAATEGGHLLIKVCTM